MSGWKRVKGEGEIYVILGIVALAGWATHIVTCLSEDRWVFLIAGAMLIPVGVIHGIGIWFGAW